MAHHPANCPGDHFSGTDFSGAKSPGGETQVVTERFLTCSICLERFQKPKVLLCQHTFCCGCIDAYVKKNCYGETFRCPVCQADTSRPAEGAAGFRNNFFINSLLDFFDPTAATSKLCTVCSLDDLKVSAVSKCLDCSDYLCGECSTSHQKTRQTRSHKIMPISEIKKQSEMESVPEIRSLPCAEHPDENVRYFCTHNDCQILICRDCKALAHHDHKCISFKVAIGGKRNILAQRLQKMREKKQIGQGIAESVRGSIVVMKSDQDVAVTEINDKFQRMALELERIKDKTIEDIKTREAEMEKQMETFVEEEESNVSQLESLDEYISVMLDKAADVEFLDSYKMVLNHADSLCAFPPSSSIQNIPLTHSSIRKTHRARSLTQVQTVARPNCPTENDFRQNVQRLYADSFSACQQVVQQSLKPGLFLNK